MKGSSKFIKCILVCFLFSLIVVKSNASSEEINSSIKEDYEIDTLYTEITEVDNFGEMSMSKSTKIAGVETDLFIEFSDRQSAVMNFKETYEDVFAYLQVTFNLPELSENNFYDYYNAFLESSSYPDSKYYYELSLFKSFSKFMDIFENTESNLEIEGIIEEIELANQNPKSPKEIALKTTGIDQNSVSDDVMDVYYLLPFWSPVVYEVERLELSISKFTSPSFAIEPLGLSTGETAKAIAYATKYAVVANSSSYQVFSADCTNFSSQILESAGINQIVTSSEHTGWWHKKVNLNHTHSFSWIRAHTFARYMGMGPGRAISQYKTFTQLAVGGDFIGADYNNDGDMNHTAFITAKGSPDTSGVYNLRIAQHTKNYHAWTSESINGWQSLMTATDRYYFIRA